jgi:anti-sigma B factor antagonist
MLSVLIGNLAKIARRLDPSVEKVGDVMVVRPKGRIAFDGGDIEIRDLVRAALDLGERRILINMSGVSYIDSSGIGELVAAFSAGRECGAPVRLCCLSPKVFSIFQMVALLKIFDVRESEEEGVAAFAGSG